MLERLADRQCISKAEGEGEAECAARFFFVGAYVRVVVGIPHSAAEFT